MYQPERLDSMKRRLRWQCLSQPERLNAASDDDPLCLRVLAHRLLRLITSGADSPHLPRFRFARAEHQRNACRYYPRQASMKRAKYFLEEKIDWSHQASVAFAGVGDTNMFAFTPRNYLRYLARRHRRQVLDVQLTVIAESGLRVPAHVLPKLWARRSDFKSRLPRHSKA